MSASAIEWTDATWNPVVGCAKVSPGCAHCYAETMAARLKAMALAKEVEGERAGRTRHYLNVVDAGGHWNGKVELVPEALADPLKWKKPRRVFVNSMSDLFHEDVPDGFIHNVFAMMALSGQHTFQVLTKRAGRMQEYMTKLARSIVPLEAAARSFGWTFKFKSLEGRECSTLPWPLPNVWLGVSVESQGTADLRIPLLLQTPAAVRFLSCEPLLGPVVLDSGAGCGGPPRWLSVECDHEEDRRLDWVIVGGESGAHARPCDLAWIRSLVEQCRAAEVACFVKQLGAKPIFVKELQNKDGYFGHLTTLALTDKKGGDMGDWPEDLRVREFPEVKP